jgi:hypothetical protein
MGVSIISRLGISIISILIERLSGSQKLPLLQLNFLIMGWLYLSIGAIRRLVGRRRGRLMWFTTKHTQKQKRLIGVQCSANVQEDREC